MTTQLPSRQQFGCLLACSSRGVDGEYDLGAGAARMRGAARGGPSECLPQAPGRAPQALGSTWRATTSVRAALRKGKNGGVFVSSRQRVTAKSRCLHKVRYKLRI